MAMSPELQRMYADNRFKMTELKRQFRLFFWFIVALSAMWFGSSFFIGAQSTLSAKGATKFFVAMSTGVMQIIFAVVTFILGSLTAQRKRLPSLIAIGIYSVCIVLLLMGSKIALSALSIGLLALSLSVHLWAQILCNHDDELKGEPGYPLFSVEADTPAEYEVSAVVRARAKQASDEMQSVGGGFVKTAHQQPTVTPPEAPVALSEMYANRVPGQAPPKLGPISLATQQVQYTPPAVPDEKPPVLEAFGTPDPVQMPDPVIPAAQPQQPPLPVVEDMLSGSDTGLSAGKRLYQPHEELLPTPEEVRARLAAMKRAREQDK